MLKAGERIEVLSDIIFYAMWSRSSYNVTFNANGAIGDVPGSITVDAGGYFIVPSHGTLSRAGYVFVGWNTHDDGEGVSYDEKGFVEGVYADIELYAQWKELHTITLDANKDDGTSQITTNVVDGGSYTVPSCGFLPAECKIFSGWSTEKNGSGKIFYEGDEIDPVTADLTLYAVWIEDPLEYDFDASSCSWIVKKVKTKDCRSIIIPKFLHDGNPVEGIGVCAFEYCTNLESIVIPDSVRSIGNSAFAFCKNLESIVIPSSVTSIGDSVFAFCTKLASIKVGFGNRAYYVDGNCLMEKASKKLVRGCSDSTVPTDTKIIGPNAFSGLVSLTQIEIPEGVESICEKAFADCYELKEAKIPSSVTSIGESAFGTCRELVEITIPENVASIGNNAFSNCSKLKKVTILEGVTSIGECAFSPCSNLVEITIPSTVTSIGSFALYNTSLKIYYGGDETMWKKCKPNDDYISYESIDYNYNPQA